MSKQVDSQYGTCRCLDNDPVPERHNVNHRYGVSFGKVQSHAALRRKNTSLAGAEQILRLAAPLSR
jgi:hypothetical protein